MQLAEIFVDALAAYALIGSVFAAAFVTRGIHQIDPVAEHAPWGFRLIVVPGVVALWPLLWMRWFKAVSRAVRP